MGEFRIAFKILNLTGKRPLLRPRQRWENDIRIDPKKIYVNTSNLIDLAEF